MVALIALVMTALALLPLLLFIAVYSGANWRGNRVGKSVMALAISEALILTVSVLTQLIGAHEKGIAIVRFVVFLFVIFSLWRQLYVLIQVRRGNARFLRGLQQPETNPVPSGDLTP